MIIITSIAPNYVDSMAWKDIYKKYTQKSTTIFFLITSAKGVMRGSLEVDEVITDKKIAEETIFNFFSE